MSTETFVNSGGSPTINSQGSTSNNTLNGEQQTSSNSATTLHDDPSSVTTSAPAPPPVTETPARSSSNAHLNPRSCVTCRRRKVRCNKENPCSNCVRAGIECIFPGPGRAPRKSRKPPDAELLARLRRLEGVVHSLGAQVDENGGITTTASSHNSLSLGLDGKPRPQRSGSGGLSESSPDNGREGTDNAKRNSIDKHLGRLVISDDRSRYVSNQFWASMGDEIAEMRDLLDAPSSEEEEEYESPSHDKLTSHQGFIFGYSSLMVDLRPLHPSPSQIFILWEVFKENVDPVVRLLHRPTAKNILMNAATSLDRVSKAAEALLFAIYFGAVVSMTEEQCVQLLDETKAILINRYRFATEQALARADFMNSSSLMCLQAFVFFLIFVRHMDNSRLVWALGGLAIHISQALGIHRDGTNFDLNPFDTEMRRRLWWHVSILDNRASEDHGTDPTFSEQFYDTKLPLNINDDDIYPDMKEAPNERVGATEMTFCLIRFELSIFSRRLNFTAPGAYLLRRQESTLQEKEQMIDSCHRSIEEKYLKYCDMSLPIYWVSATVARLILAKMWLMVHHPRSFALDENGLPLPSATKDRLFITSIEVIEFSCLLEKNENTAKWGWLFRTYMQWQSVAFVLSEICIRPPGPEIDRAWRAIESVYDRRMATASRNQRGMLWKPMRQLMAKAKTHRAEQMKQFADKSQPMVGQDFQSPLPGDGWTAGYQANNMLSATADALDLDLTGVFSPLGSDNSGSMPGGPQGMGSAPAAAAARGMSTVSNSQDSTMQDMSLSPQIGDLPNPDFLNWAGWNAGVGDFNVAPEPILQYFNTMQQEWF